MKNLLLLTLAIFASVLHSVRADNAWFCNDQNDMHASPCRNQGSEINEDEWCQTNNNNGVGTGCFEVQGDTKCQWLESYNVQFNECSTDSYYNTNSDAEIHCGQHPKCQWVCHGNEDCMSNNCVYHQCAAAAGGAGGSSCDMGTCVRLSDGQWEDEDNAGGDPPENCRTMWTDNCGPSDGSCGVQLGGGGGDPWTLVETDTTCSALDGDFDPTWDAVSVQSCYNGCLTLYGNLEKTLTFMEIDFGNQYCKCVDYDGLHNEGDGCSTQSNNNVYSVP